MLPLTRGRGWEASQKFQKTVPDHRVVWYASSAAGVAPVLVSLEAQLAVARSFKMTTDEIFEEHASDFDAQIALRMATGPAPKNGVWTLDANDIVSLN